MRYPLAVIAMCIILAASVAFETWMLRIWEGSWT